MNTRYDRVRKWWKIDAAGIAACALLAAAAFMVGFKPLLDHEAERLTQRERAAQQRRQLSDLNRTEETLRRERERVRRAVDESEVHLQPADRLNAHVAKVADLAAACGLRIHEVEPAGTVRHEHYETAPIRLAGEGAYPACAAFIRRLREAFPDTAVASFDLTGSPQSPDTPATFRFTLTWHAAPAPGPSN